MSAEIRIVPAKKYVKMDYIAVKSMTELQDHLTDSKVMTGNDFVEALVYSKSSAVLMIGNLVDEAKINKVGNTKQ